MTIASRPLSRRTLPPRALPPRALPGHPTGVPDIQAANAMLRARADPTPTLSVLSLALDAPMEGYQPGQYVAVGLAAEGGFVARPYSIVELSRDRRRIELFVRLVRGGKLSERLWRLLPGDRLRVGPPRGLFVADPHDDQRLYIGSGTGVAPLLAMLSASAEHAAAGRAVAPATLIHGVSHAAEHHYRERIATWQAAGLAVDYRPTISRPGDPSNAGWIGRRGRTEEQVARLCTEPSFHAQAPTAYICGSSSMIEACSGLLAGAGVPAGRIRIERF